MKHLEATGFHRCSSFLRCKRGVLLLWLLALTLEARAAHLRLALRATGWHTGVTARLHTPNSTAWLKGNTNLTHTDIGAHGQAEAWYTCAAEGEACENCASGNVRFGDEDGRTWSNLRLHEGLVSIPCSSQLFGKDPAPGVVKTCECFGDQMPGRSAMRRDVCTSQLRQTDSETWPEILDMDAQELTEIPSSVPPMASCEHVPSHAGNGAGANLQAAVKLFCDAGLGALVEFHVDPGFSANFEKLKDTDGWIPRAYVTYVALTRSNDKFGKEVDLLLQSVHRFSKYPILVVNFGKRVPKVWTKERFPNMVLVHGRPMIDGKSFNFNKLRAMTFTKVLTGILVDADQWVNKGMDSMFQRTEEECTADYPFPIMPVHWLARDPQSTDGYPYTFEFVASGGPNRTMRWGHAHPTWTHHAYGFLAKWTSYVLKPGVDTPRWIKAQSWEDEDILNVALWAEKASKQWCKFDIPGYEDYQKYFSEGKVNPPLDGELCPDTKWYPNGVAYLFYSVHAAKEPAHTKDCLYDLFQEKGEKPRILYNGHWFKSGKELKAFDPSLRCMA